MSIQFACLYCGKTIEADDSQAGSAITCHHCKKVSPVPEAEASTSEESRPRLKRPVQRQAFEDITQAKKFCPNCKAESDPRALICTECGYNFVTRGAVRKSAESKGGVLRGIVGVILRLALAVVLLGVGIIVFVKVQDLRFSEKIATALKKGQLDEAKEGFQKLAYYYQWLETLRWPNKYNLRAAQFQARGGKTYTETKNPKYPLVVEKAVWGFRSYSDDTAWVKFRMLNLGEKPLPIHQRYFLLVGMENNVGLAQLMPEVPDEFLLERGEGIKGALRFNGMSQPPIFLEYNDGNMVVRTPIFVDFAMDDAKRTVHNFPAAESAEEFPMWKSWAEQKLTTNEVRQTWQAFAAMRPPPPQPKVMAWPGQSQ